MALTRCANCGELYRNRRIHCPECGSTKVDEYDIIEEAITNKELADLMRVEDIDEDLGKCLEDEILGVVAHGKEG